MAPQPGPSVQGSLLLEGEEGLWFRGDEEEIDVTTFVDRENMRIVTTFDHFSTRTITKKKSPNALTSILNTWFGDYFHWLMSEEFYPTADARESILSRYRVTKRLSAVAS